LLRGQLPDYEGRPSYVLDAPDLFDRPGTPYAEPSGALFPDNHWRFAALSWAAAQLGLGFDGAWWPDVVHAHDWHTGLVPAYLAHSGRRRGEVARSVFTIHNLAYQGLYPASVFAQLGLPASAFAMEGVEFYGQLSFMKAGLHHADAITTVSPTYAREIQTEPWGCGLDGLLRRRSADVHGVLNGVDARRWNPARDPLLAAPYSHERLAGKQICKRELQRELGLAPANGMPLVAVVSRLVAQKGMNLVLAGLDQLIRGGAQLVVLGQGDPALEAGFIAAAQQYPGQVAAVQGMNEGLAHRVIAGSDVMLVPSEFEPCGLTQLYALAYGSLPLVRRVGGLADTVVDCSLENLADGSATGVVFERFELDDYLHALRRVFTLWETPSTWQQVQQAGMRTSHGWDRAAQAYAAIYQGILQ
jgi:starch synthase